MIGVSGRAGRGLPPRGRTTARRWLTTATMVTVAATLPAVAVTALATTAANGATPERIGTAPQIPHGAAAAGAPSGGSQLNLDVELAPRDPAALQAFVTAVSDPHSVEYKHYLAKGEFAGVFGPTQQTIDAVSAQLRAEGFTPGPVSSDGLTIPVTTTVAQAGSALGTGFANYRLADGRTAYVNTAAPQLPSSVASMVTGIVGLNDIADTTPHITSSHVTGQLSTSNLATGRQHNSVSPHAVGGQICDSLAQSESDNNQTDTVNYWSPDELAGPNAFNSSGLYNNYGNTGSGVTVGVFELENFDPVDVQSYEDCFGVNTPVSTIKVDGGPTTQPGPNAPGVGEESALDMETIAAMAPGVSILDYEGPDGDGATDRAVLDTYEKMVSDDRAQVISTSWGECELVLQQSDPSFVSAETNVFNVAAAQGQSVLAASGDTGSTDCLRQGGSTVASLSVDDPAGQPNVTGVGGTTMVGNPPAISAWNRRDTAASPAGAGGGGISAVHVLSGAGNYQSGVTGPGYSNVCNAPAGATCRQVPDVSALADGNDGYLVAFGSSAPNEEDVHTVGGTSGAAPLVASFVALADASTACAANGPAGLLNPALYQHASVMKDVTTGSNSFPESGFTGTQYQAGTGYDMATGLGSPNAASMVEAVCDAKAASPGSTYVPLAPSRILDTRNKVGVGTTTPIGPNGTVALQVTGKGSVPASGVTAVVLNVTAVSPTAAGFLTVFPDGGSVPASSNLNFTPKETIPNLVTVPVGSDGKVDFFNKNGSTQVLADLEGYYTTTANTGSGYQPVTPVRLLDTRNAVGVSTRTPVAAGGTVKLPIEGNAGVPASGVTAVVLNVTAVSPTANSFLSVFPDGTALPGVSNLNFTPSQTIPNLVTVAVGSDGAVDIFNHVGTVHVLADLAGYYTSSGGLKFHASFPHRLLDTRGGVGVAAGQPAPVGTNTTLSFPLTDTLGTGNLGPLATAGGLVLNVTAVSPTASSFVTVFPNGVSQPGVSNLNFTAGQTIPNSVITPVNGNSINFFNHSGNTGVIADLLGYFAAS